MGCDCPICLHRRGPPYHHVAEEEKQPLSLELPFKLKEYGSPPPRRLDAPPLQRTLVKEAAPTISSNPPWDIIAGGICMLRLALLLSRSPPTCGWDLPGGTAPCSYDILFLRSWPRYHYCRIAHGSSFPALEACGYRLRLCSSRADVRLWEIMGLRCSAWPRLHATIMRQDVIISASS